MSLLSVAKLDPGCLTMAFESRVRFSSQEIWALPPSELPPVQMSMCWRPLLDKSLAVERLESRKVVVKGLKGDKGENVLHCPQRSS